MEESNDWVNNKRGSVIINEDSSTPSFDTEREKAYAVGTIDIREPTLELKSIRITSTKEYKEALRAG